MGVEVVGGGAVLVGVSFSQLFPSYPRPPLDLDAFSGWLLLTDRPDVWASRPAAPQLWSRGAASGGGGMRPGACGLVYLPAERLPVVEILFLKQQLGSVKGEV